MTDFEYVARRKPRNGKPVEYGPDNKAFGKRFWADVATILIVVFAFVVAGIIILILMGALKFLGVKSLE